MSVKQSIIILIICMFLYGCAHSDSEAEALIETRETSTTDVFESNAEVKEQASNQSHVTETVLDHLFVDADVVAPDNKLSRYNTVLKKYNTDDIKKTLWPDVDSNDIEIEADSDDFTVLKYEDENASFEAGNMGYYKGENTSYILTLISYAEEEGLLERKDLSFMPEEQALLASESLLASLKTGGQASLFSAGAICADDLLVIQGKMKNDEDYEGFFSNGKYQEIMFEADTDIYYFRFHFMIDEIPVISYDEPPIETAGGVERGAIAWPVEAAVLYSNQGPIYINISGAFDVLENSSATEEAAVIGYSGIRESLIKKYGDVILTENYYLNEIWLEYFPLIREDSFDQIELIPVWCCKLDTDDYDNYAIRINAFTGEEVS